MLEHYQRETIARALLTVTLPFEKRLLERLFGIIDNAETFSSRDITGQLFLCTARAFLSTTLACAKRLSERPFGGTKSNAGTFTCRVTRSGERSLYTVLAFLTPTPPLAKRLLKRLSSGSTSTDKLAGRSTTAV